jgi:hypothetical protein
MYHMRADASQRPKFQYLKPNNKQTTDDASAVVAHKKNSFFLETNLLF